VVDVCNEKRLSIIIGFVYFVFDSVQHSTKHEFEVKYNRVVYHMTFSASRFSVFHLKMSHHIAAAGSITSQHFLLLNYFFVVIIFSIIPLL